MSTYRETNKLLKKVKAIFPKSILEGAIKHLINPPAFKSEFKQQERHLDKYFSHISVANKENLKALTIDMPELDMTDALELIAAKILIGIQRASMGESSLEADSPDWLSQLYYR